MLARYWQWLCLSTGCVCLLQVAIETAGQFETISGMEASFSLYLSL